MTTFAGTLNPSPTYDNVTLWERTSGIDGFDLLLDYATAHLVTYGTVFGGTSPSTDTQPTDALVNAQPGFEAILFSHDYYHRVHIVPRSIVLGNLLSDQTRDIEVWNAHFGWDTLFSLGETGTEGITESGLTPPDVFGPLQSKILTIIVTTDGPAIIDALYTFSFTSEAPTLTVTGRRVVPWPFMPQTKHGESMEWKTDLIPSYNSEQRIALRPAPRQSFNYTFRMVPEEFSRAKAISTQGAHLLYGVPVWSESTRVGALSSGATEILFDTAYADYRADGLIVVWESSSQVLAIEISAVAADRVTLKLPLDMAFTNAYVAPMRLARASAGVSFSRSGCESVVAKALFQVSDNKDLGASVGYTTYRSKDVLTTRTVISESISERIMRSLDMFDNGSGPVVVDVKANWVTPTSVITFDTTTKAARWAARKWLHSRRGKQKAFWLPSWNKDMVILSDAGTSSNQITIAPIGYPVSYGPKDIMIQLKNGTKLFGHVTGGVTDGSGNEVLSIDPAIGVAYLASDVDFACFMSHVRFDTDKVDVQHDQGSQAAISVPVRETPE